MRKLTLQAAKKIKNQKHRKWWQRAVRVMGMAVVFCTTYALILPAITMEQGTICGIEAHEHVESCYTQQPVTVYDCGIAEGTTVVHSHDQICYDGEGLLICPLPEVKEHTHSEKCYTQALAPACEFVHVHSAECVTVKSVLVCGVEENAGHTHGEACATEKVLICEIPEAQGHAHDANCAAEERVLVCLETEGETHTHDEACYEVKQIPCEIPEAEGHTHGEGCYEVREAVCQLEEQEGHTHTDACYAEQEVFCEVTALDGHVHEDACYPKQLVCTNEEVMLHEHTDTCYDAEGSLTCQLPVVAVHAHTEQCLKETMQDVLTCELEAHVHDETCYPAEEETEEGITYICAMAAHSHVETCVDLEGNVICNIPVHTHEAACIVEDLDLHADEETAQEWEQIAEQLTFTGVWAEDLLTMAQSQLSYRESSRNCILVNEELKGYTRFGDWYGEPYMEWDAAFVSFCLHYAGIGSEYIPYESDTASWVGKLTQAGLYSDADTAAPAAGDLVFVDTDEDGAADHVGIAVELLPENEIKIIAGNSGARVDYEVYKRNDDTIVGYGKLPENPLSPEEWSQAMEAKVLLGRLPNVETVQENLKALNDAGDKAAYEALRQEVYARIDAATTAYNVLSDLQKAVAGELSVDALLEAVGGQWQEFPELSDDSAVISELTVLDAQVIPNIMETKSEDSGESAQEADTDASSEEGMDTAVQETDEEVSQSDMPENAVQSQDEILFRFQAAAESYYSDVRYGKARMKVELVLPLTQDKALFQTEEMTWLEESKLTFETRVINGETTICQVLTGYRTLTGEESGIAVPGSFAETVAVKLKEMNHGEQVYVIISAAMEYSTWDDLCQTHGIEEKLTVTTKSFTYYDPLSAEERDAIYREYLAQIESLNAVEMTIEERRPMAELLKTQIADSFGSGELSNEEVTALATPLRELFGYYAEYADGNMWILGGATAFTPNTATTVSRTLSLRRTAALSAAVMNALNENSDVQIIYDEEGETNPDAGVYRSGDDKKVFIRKTIDGTEQENVFDITLEVITADTVESVYEDPDMAVVIVMDISNTMKTGEFIGMSRYAAALQSAEHFMDNFAEKVADNKGLSKLGFVAFNTHAHEIFPLSDCSTPEDVHGANGRNGADSLVGKMKSACDAIIEDTDYASSTERYTNMEAGLRRGYDMIKDAPNKNKYIIFLSDGFPTTYLKRTSETSGVLAAGYQGYNPERGDGTNGRDGVFYDAVKGWHCDYGTSYSDTAAIYARQMATSIKEKGVEIFSIGINVAGQTIKKYHDDTRTGFSVVERRNSSYSGNVYEIGAYDNTASFENWLKGSKKTDENSSYSGIGSGYYYPSTDLAGLESAYDAIFELIEQMNADSAHLDWTTADPMPDLGMHEPDAIEFLGFWDRTGTVLVADDPDESVYELQGQSGFDPQTYAPYENHANFDTEEATIQWDLKNSGYYKIPVGEYANNYMMSLKYRVRLKNEKDAFSESAVYATNDVTTLKYRIIEVKNNVTSISGQKEIDYPIPSVKGYLSELNFLKTDSRGVVLPGAKFTLVHDTAACEADSGTTCAATGVSTVAIADQKEISGTDGKVSFTNIPSGHHYLLTEVEAPDGYVKTNDQYRIVVSYDAQSVTVTDADGNVLKAEDGSNLDWGNAVVNDTYYQLPQTGGMGTSHLTFGGVLMLSAAACVYIATQFGRKRQKGGKYGR